MKNKKEGLFIQCIVCSLLPLITLFIPYLKFGISVPLLGKVMEQLTGMDLLKVMGNVNNRASLILKFADDLEQMLRFILCQGRGRLIHDNNF